MTELLFGPEVVLTAENGNRRNIAMSTVTHPGHPDSAMAVLLTSTSERPHDGALLGIAGYCIFGQTLLDNACDCNERFLRMETRVEDEQNGLLICTVGSDRFISEQLPAYFQARQQGEACPASRIDYGLTTRIIGMLGLQDLRLLEGTPEQFEALESFGAIAG